MKFDDDHIQSLDQLIAKCPHVRFAVPYNYPADLAAIYGDVH